MGDVDQRHLWSLEKKSIESSHCCCHYMSRRDVRVPLGPILNQYPFQILKKRVAKRVWWLLEFERSVLEGKTGSRGQTDTRNHVRNADRSEWARLQEQEVAHGEQI